ncbi:MAG: hypothetical protein AAF620_18385 [Bacteroidota bacterium]
MELFYSQFGAIILKHLPQSYPPGAKNFTQNEINADKVQLGLFIIVDYSQN